MIIFYIIASIVFFLVGGSFYHAIKSGNSDDPQRSKMDSMVASGMKAATIQITKKQEPPTNSLNVKEGTKGEVGIGEAVEAVDGEAVEAVDGDAGEEGTKGADDGDAGDAGEEVVEGEVKPKNVITGGNLKSLIKKLKNISIKI